MQQVKIQFHDLHPTVSDLLRDVIQGLANNPRAIPPKYFYDQRGSELFDSITKTEEYYPTRKEIKILRENADDIAKRIGTGSLLVEPGGGSCSKVRILLSGLQPCAYVPMDISKDHLWAAAEQMSAEFPWLEIHAACTDFTVNMNLPKDMPVGTRVAFFPGSSIGNFNPSQAVDFLATIAQMVRVGGYLLIGVDLKKDKDILEQAYNDSSEVTARFNMNLLARINQELSANFNLPAWQHVAFYNDALSRIEMHLKSLQKQTVNIDGQEFHFAKDETIHTENSYKYSVKEFQNIAEQAGFEFEHIWTDDQGYFSVQLYTVPE